MLITEISGKNYIFVLKHFIWNGCAYSNCLIFIHIDSRRVRFYMKQRNPDVANDFELVSTAATLIQIVAVAKKKKKSWIFLQIKTSVHLLQFFLLSRIFSLLLKIFSLILMWGAMCSFYAIKRNTFVCYSNKSSVSESWGMF